eukprot:5257526-Alexandrium_andersonii.AAC.1
MSASLVGSEMCIRDSSWPVVPAGAPSGHPGWGQLGRGGGALVCVEEGVCLLYTSDAADDM